MSKFEWAKNEFDGVSYFAFYGKTEFLGTIEYHVVGKIWYWDQSASTIMSLDWMKEVVRKLEELNEVKE